MLEHILHVGVVVEVDGELAFFHNGVNFDIELRDLQIKVSLMLLHFRFHLVLDFLDKLLQAGTLFLSILDGIRVFFLNFETEVIKGLD